MNPIVGNLMEMGFTKEKAELAVSRSGADSIHTVMDWILSHEEELEALSAKFGSPDECNMNNTNINSEPCNEPSVDLVAKSMKCDDCGKLFQNQSEVELHTSRVGHTHFTESTEEKKNLTEEETREQLAKIEAKLRQRRLDREAREKLEELEREKNRIKSGKELSEAKKKFEEQEMKKCLDQRKREKEEEKLARQRVKEQIEQDKLARRAKFSGQSEEPVPPKPSNNLLSSPKPTTSYSEARLQIRLTDGSTLTQTFQAKEPLSAVRLYIELNRGDGKGPFNLMVFPRKIFSADDYEKPLESLGLAPNAVVIVSKAL